MPYRLLRRPLRAHQRDIPAHVLSPKNVTRFSKALGAKLRDANPAFRKAYIRTFIDRIDVGEQEIHIRGPKAALINSLAAQTGAVPGFAPEWWWTQPGANPSL